MREGIDNLVFQFISVWVRDPRIQKKDFWHAHMDYEICIHTNSLCFTKKISCVRRRYRDFVWLRQKLQANSLLMVQLPELPPKNPFFNLNNAQQITERMKGLQKFLQLTLESNLLLSDSCLHLFLQSELGVSQIEACASGRTHYSVSQAVLRCGCKLQRFHSQEDLLETSRKESCDSDSVSGFVEPAPSSKDGAASSPTETLDLSLRDRTRPNHNQEETLALSLPDRTRPNHNQEETLALSLPDRTRPNHNQEETLALSLPDRTRPNHNQEETLALSLPDRTRPNPNQEETLALSLPDRTRPNPDQEETLALSLPDRTRPNPDQEETLDLSLPDRTRPNPDQEETLALSLPDRIRPNPDQEETLALSLPDRTRPNPNQEETLALSLPDRTRPNPDQEEDTLSMSVSPWEHHIQPGHGNLQYSASQMSPDSALLWTRALCRE
ncbi:sorting nexin-10B [Oncorhynchus mykiss]|uniref:PX domain-containing protein n=1 Tax=Oncorhynchus mykiss TaxID=8022 RepID=A0A8K9V2P2_ONCMY|nr:sorting nexin-10B [Oncorhynchus mykiss]